MFHVGHLNLLEKAREHCDTLIVGISSDSYVMENKGKTPIIHLEDRKRIVSALSIVDKVVVQNDKDKVTAMRELGADVLFVGDDWKGSEYFIEIELRLKDLGKSVEYFQYTDSVSSSNLRKMLLRK